MSRPRKSATESLLGIVLVLDALMLFFVMLAFFGLDLLPPVAAFGAGIASIVVCALLGRMIAKPWAQAAGWVLHAGFIALGFVLAPMFFVGIAFAALWVYCFVMGRKLDGRALAQAGPAS